MFRGLGGPTHLAIGDVAQNIRYSVVDSRALTMTGSRGSIVYFYTK
jgi:hypothetical protein